MPSSGRRLTLSPIGFDIVLALSQAPVGLRLADLAHIIGSPVSSVQTALRILISNKLVERVSSDPPHYALAKDHPARDELASLATVLPDAAHAIGVILRANPSVRYAAVDSYGFLVAERPGDRGAGEALDHHLGLVAGARPEAPSLVRMSEDEFGRIARVALGLRARARAALTIKGRLPAGLRADESGEPASAS
ncbi:MAG TPA: helix-turn-helix domain-containing protein [Candidatus Limnocylindrales bacterium]|nr:helix-turn-helix domain-containing protein [Candidatus Limnocylindrales bacterium]